MIKGYLKLQTDIMKAANKYAATGKATDFDYSWYQDSDNIYVIDHKVCMITVPKQFWYLNNDKIFEKPPVQGQRMLQWLGDADTPLVDTGELKKWGKIIIHKFILDNPNADEIYVSEDLLKRFNIKDCYLVGTKSNAPVFIMHDGNMEGMILPVNTKNQKGEEE